MADSKITLLTALTAADPANDMIPIVDVSDTPPASGNTKRISINNILACSPSATLASATISGDLTVDTSTLKVDSTNNRVLIGTLTALGSATLSIAGKTQSDTAVAGDVIGNFNNSSATGYGFRIGGGSATGGYALSVNNNAGSEFHQISGTGIATWSNVGGVAGTAMTLNSTGLGVGIVPSGGAKLAIRDSGANDSYIGLGANNDIYLSTGASGVHYFRKAAAPASMTLDASGNLLVGTTASGGQNGFCVLRPLSGGVVATTTETAHNFGALTGTTYATFLYATTAIGSITQNGTTGVLYNITSDYRLKESVQPLVGGLARVNALKPSVYRWKSDGSNGEGFLAHELAEVVPFAVSGEKDAVNEDGSIKSQGIDMSRVVPILVAAIQELAAEVNALKNA